MKLNKWIWRPEFNQCYHMTRAYSNTQHSTAYLTTQTTDRWIQIVLALNYLGSIRFNSCSVFLRSISNCSVRSLISSSKLFEYFSSIWNIVSTKFTFRPWFNTLNRSYTLCGKWTSIWKRKNESWECIRSTFDLLSDDARQTIYKLIQMTILTHQLKSGRSSGCSDQHWRMILMASGGAAPFDTDGRINGGGFFSFDIISSADRDSMQYGSPRTTTSCIIIPNE